MIGLRVPSAALAIALLAACPSAPADDDDSATPAPPDDDDATPTFGQHDVPVLVTLDGAPADGVRVLQGGVPAAVLTDASGAATVAVDFDLDAELWLVASHPEARQGAVSVPERWADGDGPLTIDLVRFDPSDNPDYVFRDPGEPDRRESTEQCAHCHVTINSSWIGSVHRTAANNPVVQDVYAGAAAAFADEAACEAAGGRWWEGLEPGVDAPGMRCYVGDGALPDLNAGCGDDAPCDGVAANTGACADCHAPGIDGALGGRDLLEATGFAYDYGVHCDVCHKVESVVPDAPAGVAGRLHIVRPSEPNTLLPFQPLYFGPFHDVANPFMGAVQRDHFLTPALCRGCHELHQPPLGAGAPDPARWPDGTLPVHTTWTEWSGTNLNPAVPCQGCHMPADNAVTNSADLQLLDVGVGIATGWVRPPGSVAKHHIEGPRTDGSVLVALAVRLETQTAVDAGELSVELRTTNVGAGHAVPTGEPLRALILTVEASCEGEPLRPLGGDAVPDLGGALDQKAAAEDWSIWPGASVGDVVRVVALPGGFHDYPGVGPFGDGTFDAEAKGVPVVEVVGSSTVAAVDGDAVTFDAPLPAGDLAFRGDARSLAGAPGFAFGKVLADAAGARFVPHHRAVDVVSDLRIPAGERWTSNHRFEATCAEPVVTARLIHRPYPEALRRERGWPDRDQVIASIP